MVEDKERVVRRLKLKVDSSSERWREVNLGNGHGSVKGGLGRTRYGLVSFDYLRFRYFRKTLASGSKDRFRLLAPASGQLI